MTKTELEKQILEILKSNLFTYQIVNDYDDIIISGIEKSASEIASLIKPIYVPTEKESDITKRVVIHGWKENDYFRFQYFEGWEDCFNWVISEILKRNK